MRNTDDEREDAYYVFVIPLIVLLTSAVIGAYTDSFWIAVIVGTPVTAALAWAYRRWQGLPHTGDPRAAVTRTARRG